jgi:arylamine N-acetyltransferase
MSKMKATNFVLADYLNRIGFKGDIDISLPTLFGLMKRQLKSVAFENTTVQKKQTP